MNPAIGARAAWDPVAAGCSTARLPRATPTWICAARRPAHGVPQGSQGRKPHDFPGGRLRGDGARGGRAIVRGTALRRRGLRNSQTAHPARSRVGSCCWSSPTSPVRARSRSRAGSSRASRGRCMSSARCVANAPNRPSPRRHGRGLQRQIVGAGRSGEASTVT